MSIFQGSLKQQKPLVILLGRFRVFPFNQKGFSVFFKPATMIRLRVIDSSPTNFVLRDISRRWHHLDQRPKTKDAPHRQDHVTFLSSRDVPS